MKRKLSVEQTDMFSQGEVEIVSPTRSCRDYAKDIQKLPYVFRDRIRFDRKNDPRSKTYGSKITAKDVQAEHAKYYRLRRVIAPHVIELSDDTVVRLLGIGAVAKKETEAVKWLTDKLKDQSIYLRFDEVERDEENRRLSYVYLRNKTFVNLHFLRSRLVQLDDKIPFRYQQKFRETLTEHI